MKQLLRLFAIIFILLTERLISAQTPISIKSRCNHKLWLWRQHNISCSYYILHFIFFFWLDILGNLGSSAELTFRAPLGVDASLISCEWRHNGNVISTSDGSKYSQPTPRRLRISTIVGDDEGDYTCRYYYNQFPFSETVARINVIGNNVRGMLRCPARLYCIHVIDCLCKQVWPHSPKHRRI